MKVEELKQKKKELEEKVGKLLEDFTKETKLDIEKIDVDKIQTIDGEVISYQVSIKSYL